MLGITSFFIYLFIYFEGGDEIKMLVIMSSFGGWG